jgi:hypothetical protein
MVTGVVDMDAFEGLPLAEQQDLGTPTLGSTNFCHIFSPSTNWKIDTEQLDHPEVTLFSLLTSPSFSST